jgi:TonB family protein
MFFDDSWGLGQEKVDVRFHVLIFVGTWASFAMAHRRWRRMRQSRSWGPPASGGPSSNVKSHIVDGEVLTDTRGVDFGPYIRELVQKISESPFLKNRAISSGEEDSTLPRFAIDPEGKVTNLHLDESSHNGPLDRAAWNSIAQVETFPSLPKSFVATISALESYTAC